MLHFRSKLPFILAAAFLVLCLSVSVAFSENMTPQDIEQLIIRTDNNAAPFQYESYMTMQNLKPNRKTVENKTHVYRKGDKMVAIFTSPASQKGQAFIRNGDDMWMYLPKSEKILRIGAKENSMGGEASNTDIMRGDLAKDYTATYLGDETVDDTNCYKLELKAKQRTVAYDKVIYWISQNKELPVKREYYVLSGKKIKTMYFQSIKMLGEKERPSVVVIESEENKGNKSVITTDELNPNVNLDDNMFNTNYVKRLH